MTRCVDFYEKCEKEGYDWCSKDKTTVNQIKSYLKIANKIAKYGVPKPTIFEKLPEGNIRVIHKIDEDTLEKVISYIAEALKDDNKIKPNDINGWIALARIPQETEDLNTSRNCKPTFEEIEKEPEITEEIVVAPITTQQEDITIQKPTEIITEQVEKITEKSPSTLPTTAEPHINEIIIKLTPRLSSVIKNMLQLNLANNFNHAVDLIVAEGIAQWEVQCNGFE